MSDPVRRWLVAYDIRCPRRLGRVHRRLARSGQALQYSVFCLCMNQAQAHELAAELEALIKPQDDVRLYALGKNPWYRWSGPDDMPEAVMLFDAPLALDAGPALPPDSDHSDESA